MQWYMVVLIFFLFFLRYPLLTLKLEHQQRFTVIENLLATAAAHINVDIFRVDDMTLNVSHLHHYHYDDKRKQ